MVSLLAGMYNSRPPQPRYQSTWDVDVVLNHFRGLKNSELSLPQLTRKLVTLLAISTLLRSAELASVGLESIKVADRFLSFSLFKVRKAQRAGPLQVFSLPKFGVLELDPVECVVHYIEWTLPHRSLVNGSHLFIGLVKPYKPVVGFTVANWIKKQLRESGIDTTTFSAHSTRGAASSKAARSGVAVSTILSSACWASESIFIKFYKRDRPSDMAVAEAVLQD